VLLDDRIAISTPEGVALDLVLAGLGSRILARLLDSLVQTGVLYVLNTGVTLLAGFTAGGVSGWLIALLLVFYFLSFFAYDIFFEMAWHGQTIGKRAMGLRVVRSGGRRIGFLSSCVRNIVRLVDLMPVGYLVGCVTIFCSKTNRRVGDMVAGTYVVRERVGAKTSSALAWGSRPSVAPAAVAGWDVSGVTADELALARRFLDRRLALPPATRWDVSVELAHHLATKARGLPSQSHPEYVVEGVVVAKEMRA
jgi:uncharacterized RDD family membrane protein YckC